MTDKKAVDLNRKIKLAVNGTLLRGFALNLNLIEVGAEFVQETATAPGYRLWSIDDAYPAMLRDEATGASIRLEVWALSPEGLVEVLQREPPGLCLGKVELRDGEAVFGVLAEPCLITGHEEITRWGGWREYCQSIEKNL